MKRFFLKLLFIPIWAVILLIAISGAGMAFALVKYGSEHIFTYIVYGISAYTLTVLCCALPTVIKNIKRIKSENKYIVRYMSDTRLRVQLSLFASLAYNTAYALLQLGLGLRHKSWWFISLAVYYILLVIVRYFLLRDVHGIKDGLDLDKEYRRYRFCGIVLLFMNIALSGIVLYITRFGYGFSHHYITTIALSAYTFTSFTSAVVSAVKFRRLKSPVFFASKAITLVCACVSMLTLETAMLAAFSEEGNETFNRIITEATGVAVCAFVMILAVYMIIRSTDEIRKIKENKDK